MAAAPKKKTAPPAAPKKTALEQASKPASKPKKKAKKKPAPKAAATLLTPSESQKVWVASILLLLLLATVAWIGGEIHQTPNGYRAGIRDLKGRVQWWLDLERGHWPTLKHRT